MKFYNSMGPNPRVVRMFMSEKRIEVPAVEVDILAGENRRPPYTDKNPNGQMPSLELDDGRILAETVAICEYLEDLHPTPALIGATPEEKAETRMWIRRVEFRITEPLYNGYRFAEALEMFRDRVHVIPQAADDLKACAREGLKWLDGLMEGRSDLVDDRFTLADIVLYCAIDFGSGVGQSIDPSLDNVNRWLGHTAARPSAQASLHPAAVAAGIRGA